MQQFTCDYGKIYTCSNLFKICYRELITVETLVEIFVKKDLPIDLRDSYLVPLRATDIPTKIEGKAQGTIAITIFEFRIPYGDLNFLKTRLFNFLQ